METKHADGCECPACQPDGPLAPTPRSKVHAFATPAFWDHLLGRHVAKED